MPCDDVMHSDAAKGFCVFQLQGTTVYSHRQLIFPPLLPRDIVGVSLWVFVVSTQFTVTPQNPRFYLFFLPLLVSSELFFPGPSILTIRRTLGRMGWNMCHQQLNLNNWIFAFESLNLSKCIGNLNLNYINWICLTVLNLNLSEAKSEKKIFRISSSESRNAQF